MCSSTPQWMVSKNTAQNSAPRIFCLPHAGCGASAFYNMTRRFFGGKTLYIYRYPGRETRIAEAPILDLRAMSKEISDSIAALPEEPYWVFGHSMGARIGYQLIQDLHAHGMPLPERLIISCSPAPHRAPPIDQAYKGTRDEFLSYLKKLGGMPAEILMNDELVDLLLPTLRADFALLDSYQVPAPVPKLPCPIDAIFSPDDATVDKGAIAGWKELTTGKFQIKNTPGGHFYFTSGAAHIDLFIHDP